MKKRLESELISIAHRVLKLKNKSDVDQLYRETQKLYETLSVLKFYHENFEQLKSDLSEEDLEAKLASNLSKSTVQPLASEVILEEKKPAETNDEMAIEATQEVATAVESEVVASETLEELEEEENEENEEDDEAEEDEEDEENEENEEDEEVDEDDEVEEVDAETLEEPIFVGSIEDEEVPVGEAKDDLDFEPLFELDEEHSEEEHATEEDKTPSPSKTQQISFEDLLGEDYSEPVFVKPNDITPKKEVQEELQDEVLIEKSAATTNSISDKPFMGINVGLNDRIAFVKNLFADSSEDFNRVISQLNTFDALEEAQEFIEDMVKPDYNDWKGKEEYEERFMEIIERKFA